MAPRKTFGAWRASRASGVDVVDMVCLTMSLPPTGDFSGSSSSSDVKSNCQAGLSQVAWEISASIVELMMSESSLEASQETGSAVPLKPSVTWKETLWKSRQIPNAKDDDVEDNYDDWEAHPISVRNGTSVNDEKSWKPTYMLGSPVWCLITRSVIY